MGITYRPEIDGLRAIAVLAVVLFHAGIGEAGFVGVDMFFVISGYLITSLLLKEQRATGRIDLLAFYARRVRRILPAAAVVTLAVLAVSALILPALQQIHTANSAGAALVFGANVFFQFTSGGYFDGRAEEMPLLHLWSLSVEEQFYFLWPALLMFLPAKWQRPAMAGLAVGSFALAEWWIAQGSDAAFYQMPARFWELAAGGLIAAAPTRALPRWVAPAGVLLTLGACVYPLGHFPGVGALPAVAGTSLLIAAVHGGARNAFLASRPMVAVGLISYSLYLWHWPLLAFYEATTVGEGSLQTRLILCAFAVLLAVASYRYVEQPFRRMRFRSGRTVAVGASLSVVLALSACTLGLTAKPEPADFAAMDSPDPTCRYMDTDTVFPKCPPPEGATVAIWGDSMAYAWRPAVEPAIDYSRDACPPFMGGVGDLPRDRRCAEFNRKVVAALPSDTVVLVARWAGYGGRIEQLAGTLDLIAPKVRRVVIVGPSPELREKVPQCIRQNADCVMPRAEFDAKAQPILAKLRAMAAKHPNVEVRDVTDHLCTATECPAVLDGVALYWDTHHVSATMAAKVRLAD